MYSYHLTFSLLDLFIFNFFRKEKRNLKFEKCEEDETQTQLYAEHAICSTEPYRSAQIYFSFDSTIKRFKLYILQRGIKNKIKLPPKSKTEYQKNIISCELI